MYIRDIKQQMKDIALLEIARDEMSDKIMLAKKLLQETCHHPKQYVKIDEYYSPGGYLNTDYTDRTPYCELCGERGETQTEHHGNYG